MSTRRKPNSGNPARRNPYGAGPIGAASGAGNVWITLLRDDHTGAISIGGVWLSEDDARACGIRCPIPDTGFFPLGPVGIGRDLFATPIGRTIIDADPGTPDHLVIGERPETPPLATPGVPQNPAPANRRRWPFARRSL